LFENVTFAGVPEEVFDTTAPFKRVRKSFTAVGVPVITWNDRTSDCIDIFNLLNFKKGTEVPRD
jgi:hypothetical protein